MNLQIRDVRARELASKLAEKRGTTMTEAVVTALENELRRDEAQRPLHERVAELVEKLHRMSPGGGRDMTKGEIDEMWGHD